MRGLRIDVTFCHAAPYLPPGGYQRTANQFGGDAFWLMGPYKDTTEPLLKVLNAPYSVISKKEEISQAIVDAQGRSVGRQEPGPRWQS